MHSSSLRILRGLVFNVLDSNIVVNEFGLHYSNFSINTITKRLDTFILQDFASILPLLVFYKDGLSIK